MNGVRRNESTKYLRLSKHPLYMLLNIAFNLIVGGGMQLDWTGVGRILCLS